MRQLRVIDISKPSEQIAATLFEAATQQGFLYIDGHDFTQNEVDELYNTSRDFFLSVPDEEKMRYRIRSNNIGYTDYSNENLDPRKTRDFKEGYNFGNINFEDGSFNTSDAKYCKKTEVNDEFENPVPPLFKEREKIIRSAIKKLYANSLKILRALAESLEIQDVGFFVERFRASEPSGTVLRFLRYPLIREDNFEKNPSPVNPEIRAGAHTDYGALTLLFQREGEQGLQLQLDGETWTDVAFVPSAKAGSAPPFIVNFGDLMSYWTNGLLRSTIHRVKFSPGRTRSSDRYSIVFFVHPENTSTLIPVPSKYVERNKTDSDGPAEVLTALEHLQRRLAETYKSPVGAHSKT